MLSLGYGEPGSGKSSQHKYLCTVLPDSLYLSLEYKDIEMLERSGIQFKMIECFDDQYIEDPVATLESLNRAIHEIITTNKYKNIVIDGVSDIRSYATEEWIYYDNMDRKRSNLPPRKTIHGDNLAAWQMVNGRVKKLLLPIINWANVTRNNVFFTAQFKDAYMNKTKVGRTVNVGDWCEYKVDLKIEFCHDTLDSFRIKIPKFPDWSNDTSVYDMKVEKTGLLQVLIERGLIR